MAHIHVDVAIIGAGTAGLSARQEVARHTDAYVVIDPGPLGTTCARVGCMPSKALIHAANVHHQLVTAPPGCGVRPLPTPDSAAVMDHVRRLRDFYVAGVLEEMEQWRDTHFIQKRARFLDPHTLDLEGERVTADRIIVATGSSPVVPQAWRDFGERVVDTDRFFELQRLPSRFAVIGLGPVGIELAQAMQRLGVDVTAVTSNPGLGGLTDPEIQSYAYDHFSRTMEIWLDTAELEKGAGKGIRVRAGERTIEVELVLAALGRRPSLAGLGLENLGVTLNEDGLPEFDPVTLKVEGLPIFLAGDVNGMSPVLHEATDEGRIAGYNACQQDAVCFMRRTPLAITFTSPNIALVGSTYRVLQEEGREFVYGKVGFEQQGRARLMNEAVGVLKVYVEPRQGKLLGAEMFAPAGEHLAHLLAWAVTMEMTVADLLKMPYYHPVLEEGLRTALRDAAKDLTIPISYNEIMRCKDAPVP